MLKNIVEPEWKLNVFHELCFDDGHNNGFGFPCDAAGNPMPDLPEPAKKNLAYCLAHPEKFVRFNEVVRYEQDYREPGHGTCGCGQEVMLVNHYMGACQCPNCGQWYNLFGQELKSPHEWDDGDPHSYEEEEW